MSKLTFHLFFIDILRKNLYNKNVDKKSLYDNYQQFYLFERVKI